MRAFFLFFIILSNLFTLSGQTTDLIISEYVEGSASNRALELYNGTGSTISLSNYRLERDLNGGSNFSYYYNLTGTLGHGQTLVICHPNAVAGLKAKADVFHQVITEFTGDDQVRLLKNGVEIDRIGIPGGVNFAQNLTLVRKSSVLSPSSGPQDPRSNNQWVSHPIDFFDNLGLHEITSGVQDLCGEAIHCDGLGNVSIGTTDPKGFKLAVAGRIVAEELVIKLRGEWADYVFYPNYNLRSLAEVEEYIATYGHLPEVPSAQQVQENGFGVGEMNAVLLKKVEELMLYVIELQKQVDELKNL